MRCTQVCTVRRQTRCSNWSYFHAIPVAILLEGPFLLALGVEPKGLGGIKNLSGISLASADDISFDLVVDVAVDAAVEFVELEARSEAVARSAVRVWRDCGTIA